MENNKTIVYGEAPETDSENEDDKQLFHANKMMNSIQGAAILGEDSESEEENGSVSSAVSALTNSHISAVDSAQSPHINPANDSLLHRKLRECNSHLYSDIINFGKTFVQQAGKNLTEIDQRLLYTQITMQAAVTSLRSLNQHSSSLKHKLESIVSANFIPNIQTNQ